VNSRGFRILGHETALIVADIQVDFCSPEGSTAKRGHANTLMQALPPKVNAFVRKIHPLGVLVVYTQAIVDEDNLPENMRFFNEIKGINRPTKKGSGGEELYGLEIPANAVIVPKIYADPFASTPLKSVLDSRTIRNVLVCGVRTEICVDSTARRANAEGYNVFILTDLVATRDNKVEAQQRVLEFFDAYFGFAIHSDMILQMMQ
jgi:nicotinamidase-related amidase